MRILGSLAVVLSLICCGNDPQGEFCSDAPTFTNHIRPTIVEEKCIQCHSETKLGTARNGAPDDLNFDSYDSTEPHLAAFADAIASGREPPMGLDPPLITTGDERSLVAKWRMCGFER